MPPRLIFISYRRTGDASGYAGRIFEALERRFAHASVFMDVTDIDGGDEFGEELSNALASCVVFLPVMGRGWSTIADQCGGRRLDNPVDWVRREVEAALNRKITVIPLLVEGASMPDASSLPPSLRSLAGRQALELSDTRWTYDVRRLIRLVEAAIGVRWWHALLRRVTGERVGVVARAVRGVLVALALGLAVLMWYGSTFPAMPRSPGLYSIALITGLLGAIATDWVLVRLGRRDAEEYRE